MGTLKKTAAILCGAATLALAGVSAFSVNAFETVDLEDRADELNASKMMYVADEVYAAAGETVNYSVYVQNNTGYSSGGITMYYDPALQIVMADEIKAKCEKGPGADGLTMTHSLNSKANIFGFSVMGTDNCKNDGIVFKIQFTVPENAEAGAVYPIRLETVQIIDEKSELVDCTTVAGWIKVPDAITTTTTTVTVTTTSTQPISDVTTTTTAEPAPPVTTTTTSAPGPDGGTTTTTSAVPKDEGTTTSTIQTDRKTEKITDDTQHNPGDQEQTTAKRTTSANNSNPNAGKKSEATKTGDTGVAVAAAALMIAGASAVIFRRKEH